MAYRDGKPKCTQDFEPDYKDQCIKIQRVQNGFIISPRPDDGGCVTISEQHVFQSFSEMIAYLEKHFSFRNIEEIKIDK